MPFKTNLKRFIGLLIIGAVFTQAWADNSMKTIYLNDDLALQGFRNPPHAITKIPKDLITIYESKQNIDLIINGKEWVNNQRVIELGE